MELFFQYHIGISLFLNPRTIRGFSLYKKGTRTAFLFFLLFNILPERFHHLIGDDVFHAAGVFFGKFGLAPSLVNV